MKKISALTLITAVTFSFASAQSLEFKTIDSKITEDFSFFPDGLKGFAPSPAAGQFNSNTWKVTGIGSTDMQYGETKTTSLFTSGDDLAASAGSGVSSIFDHTINNFFLGFKAATSSGGTLNPGAIYARVQNNTGAVISSIDISYVFKEYNQGTTSNSLNLSYSTDGTNFTPVTALNKSTVQGTGSTAVISTNLATTITGINVCNGNYITFKWDTKVVSGSSSSDVFGFDDLSLTPHSNTTSCTAGGDDGSTTTSGGGTGSGGGTTTATPGDLIITEFATEGSAEWVEIYNASATTQNLREYNITQLASSGALSTKYWLDAVDGTKTIAPGEYVVVIDNGDLESAFTARWPSFDFSKAIVVTSLALSNGTTGDEIIISKKDASGSYVVIDQVNWLSSTELKAFTGGTLPGSSTGETASRTNTDNTKSSDDVANWQLCSVGTPGKANTCAPTGISEVLLQVDVVNNGNGTFDLTENANVIVYNILGNVIYTANNTSTINISTQPQGSYIAIVEKEGKAAVIRLNK